MTYSPLLSTHSRMTDAMKRKQVRVYLDKDDERRFDDLVKSVAQLSESSLLSLLVHAALEAVEDHGGRISLPLKFHVLEEKDVPVVPSGRRR